MTEGDRVQPSIQYRRMFPQSLEQSGTVLKRVVRPNRSSVWYVVKWHGVREPIELHEDYVRQQQ